MFRLTTDELKFLAHMSSIDSISFPAFGDEVYLHKRKRVGMYIPKHGVVLKPVYAELTRFEDLIKVGQNTELGIRYCIYSITAKIFVVPIMFTDNNPYGGIWEQMKLYRRSLKQSTDP